jgi:predicted nuclease of predicted toxin-antitoxin system
MKFLVDMNLSPGWVAFLVDAGFEAVHWIDIGPAEAADAELIQWAAAHGSVVLTNDLGFGAILAATQRQHPSVVQLRGDVLTPGAIGSVLLTAVRQAAAELAEGAILSVDTTRGRLRILPFSRQP